MPSVVNKLLGQVAPADTNPASLYSPASGVEARVNIVVVCNTTGSAATFRIFHDDTGSAWGTGKALCYDESVAANTTVKKALGIAMNDASGYLGVRSDTAGALTFTAYGTELS